MQIRNCIIPNTRRHHRRRREKKGSSVCQLGLPALPSHRLICRFPHFQLLPFPSFRFNFSIQHLHLASGGKRHGSSSSRNLASGRETQGLSANPTVRFSTPMLKRRFHAFLSILTKCHVSGLPGSLGRSIY